MDQNSENNKNHLFDPIFSVYFLFFAKYKILILLVVVGLICSTIFVYLSRNVFGKFEINLNINESSFQTIYSYEDELDYSFLCEFNRELQDFNFLLNCKKHSNDEIQKRVLVKFNDSLFVDIKNLQNLIFNDNNIPIYINDLNEIDKKVFLNLFKDAKIKKNIKDNSYTLIITVFEKDKEQLSNFLIILEQILNILITENFLKFDKDISNYYESKLKLIKTQADLFFDGYNRCKEKVNIESKQQYNRCTALSEQRLNKSEKKFNSCNEINKQKLNICKKTSIKESDSCAELVKNSKIKKDQFMANKLKSMENIIRKISNNKKNADEFIENNLTRIFFELFGNKIEIDDDIESCQNRIKTNSKNCEIYFVEKLEICKKDFTNFKDRDFEDLKQDCENDFSSYSNLNSGNFGSYTKELNNVMYSPSIGNLQSCVHNYLDDYVKFMFQYDNYIDKYGNQNERLEFKSIFSSLFHSSFNKNTIEIIHYRYIFFSLFISFGFYIFLLIFIDLKTKYLNRKG